MQCLIKRSGVFFLSLSKENITLRTRTQVQISHITKTVLEGIKDGLSPLVAENNKRMLQKSFTLSSHTHTGKSEQAVQCPWWWRTSGKEVNGAENTLYLA